MAKKSGPRKLTDSEQVTHYMDNLKHPLKDEIELLRKIIKSADKRISERIKWNAPSYYYRQDMVTFGPWKDKVLLVFHHPFIVKIKSELLEGEYKDRRLAYFKDIKDIKSKKTELTRIMNELIKGVVATSPN